MPRSWVLFDPIYSSSSTCSYFIRFVHPIRLVYFVVGLKLTKLVHFEMWKASSSRFCPKRDRGMTVPIFLALSNTLVLVKGNFICIQFIDREASNRGGLRGSLVVRMVFLPLEESSYATFARSSSDGSRKLGNCLSEALKLVILIDCCMVGNGRMEKYQQPPV
ncbi:uncharacterized protein LOC122307212 isoform X2 [Carya illinoinensis]|uniref:uncharacterized protein LOC122307212 isoform X2 n=1 Tax=Carya illinoinensis TaxID=32201 RepID=UPI001C71C87B|nr:uncharacterized protein LOC122307212 isoform X2 [Carya illinoinensis]XP_042975870.1 uncharacterized protein LOC122307212 isoform X2 [Carya illinoinensis]XP_042975871.1 uncharacterized protein LOC122307212 isoform X2 [Carya illinoinensis]